MNCNIKFISTPCRFQNKTSLNITVTQNNQGRTVHVSYVDKSEPTPHSNILHGKDFGKSDELVKYMNISQGSPGSKCNICNVTFDNTLRLNKHRRIHAHYLSCGNCRKQFATQSSLKRHMSVHDHTLRPLECSVCKARYFSHYFVIFDYVPKKNVSTSSIICKNISNPHPQKRNCFYPSFPFKLCERMFTIVFYYHTVI